ncbi:unnamed protein product [Gadus morhua 'NCC']
MSSQRVGDVPSEACTVDQAHLPKMQTFCVKPVSSIPLVHSWSTAKDADILCEARIVDPAGPQPKMLTFCVRLASSIQLFHRLFGPGNCRTSCWFYRHGRHKALQTEEPTSS